MTYPANLETVYQIRYSTFNNGNVDFIEDQNGKWEFESLDEATAIYKKTVESKEHDWVALTQTLKDDYSDYEIVEDYSWDEDGETDEEESEEDKDFTEKWFKCATKEERLELLAAAFDNK